MPAWNFNFKIFRKFPKNSRRPHRKLSNNFPSIFLKFSRIILKNISKKSSTSHRAVNTAEFVQSKRITKTENWKQFNEDIRLHFAFGVRGIILIKEPKSATLETLGRHFLRKYFYTCDLFSACIRSPLWAWMKSLSKLATFFLSLISLTSLPLYSAKSDTASLTCLSRASPILRSENRRKKN